MRTRSFLIGVLAGIGGTTWVALRVKRLRERLTPRAIARRGANRVADSMSAAARRLQAP